MSLNGLARTCQVEMCLALISWVALAVVWVISPGDSPSWQATVKAAMVWEALTVSGMALIQRATLRRAVHEHRRFEGLVRFAARRGIPSE